MKRLLVLVALVLLTCATANAGEVLAYCDYGQGLYFANLDGTTIAHYTDAQMGTTSGTAYAVGRGPNGGVLVGQYGYPGTYSEVMQDGTVTANIYSVNTAGGVDSLAGGAIYATNLQGSNAFSQLGGLSITDSQVVTGAFTGAFPHGLAVNRATNDIYLSVTMQWPGYTNGAVWKTSVSAWGTNPTLFYSAPSAGTLGGVALDASGNVWVARQGPTKDVVKLDSAGNVVQTITMSGPNCWPAGIALDSASNLYVAFNNAGKIVKFLASEGYSTQYTIATMGNAGYVVVIPEPATMVLLGLGALTMLRRKK